MPDILRNRNLISLADGRTLDFSGMPLVMGIINGTPDSFYSNSRYQNVEIGLTLAKSMIAEGADMLDVGGESSRPGSDYVDAQVEIDRVVPLIQEIRSISTIPISIDTRKRKVAEAAVGAGADIVNDISALRDDSTLPAFLSSAGIPVIIMHMRGSPKTMQANPSYIDTVEEIISELSDSIDRAQKNGVPHHHIIIDPGIGFGKRIEDNLSIIANCKKFESLQCPVLYGASRKSFIGAVTGKAVEERLPGSLSIAVLLALSGADILRVHDVGATVDALKMISAVATGVST